MSSDIEILRNAISRKHPCDACHKALDNIEDKEFFLQGLLSDIHDDYLARVSRKIPDYRGDPNIMTDIDPKIWATLKKATGNK